MTKLARDARAVLFPAFAETRLSPEVLRFLDQGGLAILVGESREEYVGRAMSAARTDCETADTLRSLANEARRRSGPLLVAVDQEMGGICRLHSLVPQFPPREELPDVMPEYIESTAYSVATRAAAMGVNVFLSPILDVVLGSNPWLCGRTWTTDIDRISSLSAAYIRGVQRGGVAATSKHFPGFSHITADPAIDASAVTVTGKDELERGFAPFRAAIEASVEMMMVGPAIVKALDPDRAALRSPAVIHLLRSKLGFTGIVMADDLDAKATLRRDSIETAAIDALNAGCDFLMLADSGQQVDDVARAIEHAAAKGIISADSLSQSAEKLRALCRTYDTGAL